MACVRRLINWRRGSVSVVTTLRDNYVLVACWCWWHPGATSIVNPVSWLARCPRWPLDRSVGALCPAPFSPKHYIGPERENIVTGQSAVSLRSDGAYVQPGSSSVWQLPSPSPIARSIDSRSPESHDLATNAGSTSILSSGNVASSPNHPFRLRSSCDGIRSELRQPVSSPYGDCRYRRQPRPAGGKGTTSAQAGSSGPE